MFFLFVVFIRYFFFFLLPRKYYEIANKFLQILLACEMKWKRNMFSFEMKLWNGLWRAKSKSRDFSIQNWIERKLSSAQWITQFENSLQNDKLIMHYMLPYSIFYIHVPRITYHYLINSFDAIHHIYHIHARLKWEWIDCIRRESQENDGNHKIENESTFFIWPRYLETVVLLRSASFSCTQRLKICGY